MLVSTGQPRDRGHRSECRGRSRVGKFSRVAAREKETQNVQTSGRATTTAATGSIHSNWLGLQLLLQQLAVAAGCCCSVLLHCGDESAPPEPMGHIPRRKKRISIITTYHYGRQCTYRWGVNMKTGRSLHFRPQWYLSFISRIEGLD